MTPDDDRATSVFTGTINWVQIERGKAYHDHLISPEERLRVAMTRQEERSERRRRSSRGRPRTR